MIELSGADAVQFDLLLQGLVRHRPWSSGAFRAAARSARHIGAALGVMDERRPSMFLTPGASYQRHVLRSALDGEARLVLGASADPGLGRWAVVPTGRLRAGFLPSATQALVDLQVADVDTLAALPGLGMSSARRLVERRRRQGSFVSLDEAAVVAQVGPAAWATAAARLQLAPVGSSAIVPALHATWQAGFRGLVEAVVDGSVEVAGVAAGTPERVTVGLLREVADRIERKRVRPRLWAPSPARLAAAEDALRRHAPTKPEAHAGSGVAVVRNQGYLPLVDQLISGASTRVWLRLFFVSAETAPVAGLLGLLGEAKARGVDVRVIVADDLPGDPHGARIVNRRARSMLQRLGVPTRRSHPDVASHAKLVLVDDNHVVVGSHNWTASSFFVHDETSMYLDSVSLAAELDLDHRRRWTMLHPAVARRRVHLGLLAGLDDGAKAVLVGEGIGSGADLAAVIATAGPRRALARALGMPVGRLVELADTAELMRALRVGEVTAAQLVGAGLGTLAKLRKADVADLRAAGLGAELADLVEGMAR